MLAPETRRQTQLCKSASRPVQRRPGSPPVSERLLRVLKIGDGNGQSGIRSPSDPLRNLTHWARIVIEKLLCRPELTICRPDLVARHSDSILSTALSILPC